MSLRSQWDPRKAAAIDIKHGLLFEEALTVFADPLARIFDDEEHSGEERRDAIVGHSGKGRLLCGVLYRTRRSRSDIQRPQSYEKREAGL